MYCDMCGVGVAIPDALKPIITDGKTIAEACLNCRTRLETAIKGQVFETKTARNKPAPKPEAPQPELEKQSIEEQAAQAEPEPKNPAQ